MDHRIGVYSGTFDPVHPGHIAFAEQALQECGLGTVVFAPEQKPRSKDHVTDISHRIAMIERAVEDKANLSVARLQSAQFTVKQTLPELHELFPGAKLTLLVGSDVVRTFLYRWEGLDTLLGDVSLAIGMRASDSQAETIDILEQLAQDYEVAIDYTFITTPEAYMSSSQVRDGTVDLSRVHPSMLEYIQEHQLYLPTPTDQTS